jgi:tetratricopeptide (TPR) repeat protein
LRKIILFSAIAASTLLSGCGTLMPKAADQARPELPKAPQLSEGELQERYIFRRNEGRRLLEAKKFGNALDAFLEANSIRGNSPDIQLYIAEAYVGLEYYDKARAFFDRYLALEKDRNPDTYRMIARIYGEQLELWDLSGKLWARVIDATSQSPIATDFMSRGRVLQRLGRKDEAIADFNRTADLAKKNKDEKLYNEANAASASLAALK